jgi:hypothetical protein
MATRVNNTSRLIVMMRVNPRSRENSEPFKETYLVFIIVGVELDGKWWGFERLTTLYIPSV